jgi:hypothetical protein
MPGKYLYEYAVIRIVPRVDREEFINAGVVLYCKDRKFLNVLYTINKERIQMLCDKVDCNEVEEYLSSFQKICRGEKDGGPIAQLDLPSRFRWLTATRSTVVQASKIHPGCCEDPQETLEKLYRQLVL